MSEANSTETFPAMLRRMLGNRLKPGAETFIEMFAADGVLEYPFAPPGLNSPLIGRDAIVENFEKLRKLFQVDAVADVSEIEARDPNTVILEYSGRGEGLITKEAYVQRYISVIRLRDGRFIHYKDYWNPIAFLLAAKGSEAVRNAKMN